MALVYLGFDFGYKRIGLAIAQDITSRASPLQTLAAIEGVPDWFLLEKVLREWRPDVLVVGLPRCIDGSEQYTTLAAQKFGEALKQRFSLPVEFVDERLSTVEARAFLFARGGYRKIKKSAVDSIAACIILEQYLSV